MTETHNPSASSLVSLLGDFRESKDWDSQGRESSPTAPSLSHTALCAPRALTTNHPWAEAGENLCTELPWTKLLNLNILWKPSLQSHLSYGDGGKENKERKKDSTHCCCEAKTKWCREPYLCREHETNTKRWGRTSPQWALILKHQRYWFMLFWFITLKRKRCITQL